MSKNVRDGWHVINGIDVFVEDDINCGLPIIIVVYSDGDTPLVPMEAFSHLDSLPCGIKVEKISQR